MQRLFSMFPSGTPGYGLLILRTLVAVSLHLDASGHLVQNMYVPVFALLLVLSTLLIAGLFTPLVAVLGGVAEIVLLLLGSRPTPLAAALGPLNALLIVLLGPGAYSVDARLFGRRVLVLRSRGSVR